MLNRRGYTLLEVSLFLAISGALTLVAIVTLGPRLNNVRFTSNMRGLQENITKEFINAEGGTSRAVEGSCSVDNSDRRIAITSTTDSAGSRKDCVLVGKLATFEGTGVRYRSIVASYDEVGPNCPSGDEDSFDGVRKCNYATAIQSGENTYRYPGGLSISSGEGRSVGYVRSPSGNVLNRFSFTESGTTSDDIALSKNLAFNQDALGVTTDEFPICFTQGSRRAQLVFSLNSSSVDLNFNEECTP